MGEIRRIEDGLRLSIIPSFAAKYGMDAGAFEATLKSIMPEKATWEQFSSFLIVANQYNLNPITKEIYAFPTRAGGIQPIVSIDGWMNLINSQPVMDGMEFVDTKDGNGKLLSITCKIFRKDRSKPTEVTEYMAECQGTSEPWKKFPARMLRHKAAIQCARYAFGFSGIVEEDEFARAESMKDVTPRTPPPAPKATQIITAATSKSEPEVNIEESRNVDDLIADWTQRLSDSPADIQSEIFELEIDPYREKGELPAQEYNKLLALVKQ